MQDFELTIDLLVNILTSDQSLKTLTSVQDLILVNPYREYSFFVLKRFGADEFKFSPIFIGCEESTLPEGLTERAFLDLSKTILLPDFKNYREQLFFEEHVTLDEVLQWGKPNNYVLIHFHTHPGTCRDKETFYSRRDVEILRNNTFKESVRFHRLIKPISMLGTYHYGLYTHMLQQRRFLIDDGKFNALFGSNDPHARIEVKVNEINEINIDMGKLIAKVKKEEKRLSKKGQYFQIQTYIQTYVHDLYFELAVKKLYRHYKFATLKPSTETEFRYFNLERGLLDRFKF